VTLTDSGRRYLERARRILADLEEAELAAESERLRPAGRLVVSAPVGFGRLHVSPVVAAYLSRYPDVTAELRLEDRQVNLVEDGIDCAVRIGHLGDSSLVARQVGSMRRIVVGAPAYFKSQSEPRTPDALAKHQTIQFGPWTEWNFVKESRELPLAISPRLVTNNADAAIQYAEAGGGVTRVLAYQAAEALRNGRLKRVLVRYEPPPLPIHIVFPSSRLLSAKVRAFIDLVTATCDWRFG
jgi:DNA-binding transcriptional LysR family regulator